MAVKCKHVSSSIRYKIDTFGRKLYAEQCRFCGEQKSDWIKRELVPSQCEPWDYKRKGEYYYPQAFASSSSTSDETPSQLTPSQVRRLKKAFGYQTVCPREKIKRLKCVEALLRDTVGPDKPRGSIYCLHELFQVSLEVLLGVEIDETAN